MALAAAAVGILAGDWNMVGVCGMALAAWLFAGTVSAFVDRAGFSKVGLKTGLRRAIGLPRSAYGLYFGHIGLALTVAGVTAVSVWKVEGLQEQATGETVNVAGYAFTIDSVKNVRGPNYRSEMATIKVERDGELVTTLYPERRWYSVEGKATTEAAIDTRWHGDIYAVLGDPNGKGGWVTRYYYNPGVLWMWIGAALMAFAGLVSLTDRRLRIGAPARAKKAPIAAVAPAE